MPSFRGLDCVTCQSQRHYFHVPPGASKKAQYRQKNVCFRTRERRSINPDRAPVARAESSVRLHTGGTHEANQNESAFIPRSLIRRIVSGLVMGAVGASVVLQGGVLFLAFLEFFVYQASQEYFGFIAAVEVKEGASATPWWASMLVTACCMALPLCSFVTGGKIAIPLALCSFVLLSALGSGLKKPRMTTLSECMLGLLYCGYLPTFWLKLRILAAPVLQSPLAPLWPVALGGLSQITVGLVATFVSIACIVASDVGAFTFGKLFGRTALTRISPGKTVEGAVGGFFSSVATALLLSKVFGWPAQPWAPIGLGAAISTASVFGDLIESAMKRDAGLKDSGELIPGHGGILDRFDSYVFTGAVAYVYVTALPLFGI